MLMSEVFHFSTRNALGITNFLLPSLSAVGSRPSAALSELTAALTPSTPRQTVSRLGVLDHILISELAGVPLLRDRWVAVAQEFSQRTYARPIAALRSGALVVDVDDDIDRLCARLQRGGRTALTIVFAASS